VLRIQDVHGCRARDSICLTETGIGGVEPSDDSLQPEQLGIDDKRQSQILLGCFGLDMGVPLHHLDQMPPMGLYHLMHFNARYPHGHQYLDH
jgi:hypothetical protein